MFSFLQNKITFHGILFVLCCLLFLFFPSVSSAATLSFMGEAAAELALYIGNTILLIGATFMWLGGLTLDTAMTEYVVGMAQKIHTGGIDAAINNAWSLIRDICNLAFIFGFVYIGIRTIIDPESASTKKFLTSLIISALLINFSLFFTKVVIDVSNRMAIEIHTILSVDSENEKVDVGIRVAAAMGVEGLYRWYDNGADKDFLEDLGKSGDISFFILGFVFLMVAGFTFLAGGVLLLIRFAALVMIMVFSPILFAATLFPKTKSYADKLWGKLLSYAFFAPIYMLLVYISLGIIEGIVKNTSSSNSLAESMRNIGEFDNVTNLLLAIIFMIFALVSAQALSLAGGKKVASFAKLGIGASTLGAAAMIGQQTVGRGAQAISQNKRLNSLATSNKKGVLTGVSRNLAKGTQWASGKTASSGLGGGVLKQAGYGDWNKGGYKKAAENAGKVEAERAAMLGVDKVAGREEGKKYDKLIEDVNNQTPERIKRKIAKSREDNGTIGVLDAKEADLKKKTDKHAGESQTIRNKIKASTEKAQRVDASDDEKAEAAQEIVLLQSQFDTLNEEFQAEVSPLQEEIQTIKTAENKIAEKERRRTKKVVTKLEARKKKRVAAAKTHRQRNMAPSLLYTNEAKKAVDKKIEELGREKDDIQNLYDRISKDNKEKGSASEAGETKNEAA